MSENYTPGCACCDPAVLGQFEELHVAPRPLEELSAQTSPVVEARLGRRGLLRGAGALGVAAAAGAASGLLGSPSPASAHGTSHLESTLAGEPALHGINTADVATPPQFELRALGVFGEAPNSGIALRGVQGANNKAGVGVSGVGCCGVIGTKPGTNNQTGAGVQGIAQTPGTTTAASRGVLGSASTPPGTPANTGVYGVTFVTGGAGVYAQAGAGLDALRVIGRPSFSSVGAGVVAGGKDSATVIAAAVTASSHVSVTLTSEPKNHAAVEWVERTPGVGFTVHLNRSVDDGASFTYFIVEPAV